MKLSPVDVRRDVELVKAGLLYADDIEILSLGQVFLRAFDEYAHGSHRNFWDLLATASDETLAALTGSTDIETVRSAARSALGSIDQTGDDSHLDQVAGPLRDQTMARLRETSQKIRAESGVLDLDPAFARKLIRYNDRVPSQRGADAVTKAYTAEIKRYLEDPNRFVLLDSQLAELVRAMIAAGAVTPPQRSISNAGEAALGTGFLSQLPAFPNASMEQVLGLRDDLSDPLTRYRSKVADLRTHLQTGPFDADLDAEVAGIWRTDIAPTLLDIRNAMADHTLAKELLTQIGTDLSKFVKEGVVPAGITIYTASTQDIGNVLTGGLALGAAVAPGLAKSAILSRKARVEASRKDLYYLYEVNRRLSQAATGHN